MFPWQPQIFRHQRRSVDDCSPGRVEMAQNSGTRGGTSHGEINSCRQCQGWTTACSSMPERDGKNQGEDNLKQASSCWFARHSLTSHKLPELASSGRLVCRWHVVFLTCYVCYVFFAFVCMISLKQWPFVESFIDMHASRQPHMFPLLSCFL